MLPINTPDKECLKLLEKQGLSEEQIEAALHLDLDSNGNFGSEWLVLDRGCRHLYIVSEGQGSCETVDTDKIEDPYIDNFTTSNRLLAYNKAQERSQRTTRVLGSCTNACKCRLLAFLNIWERIGRGEEVSADDSVFDQFNAKCPKCGTVYPDQQRRICENCSKKKGMIPRLLGYFKPYKGRLVILLLCMITTSGISLLTPIVSGTLLFDQVVSKPTFDEAGVQLTGKLHELKYVFVFVGLLLALAILSLLISICQNRINAFMSTDVTMRMKNDIFRAMSKLSVSFFNKNSSGRLNNRVNYDAVRIRSFFIDGVPHLIVHALNFIGLTIFLFILNWKLTLIVYIPVPIVVLIFKFALPKLWRAYSRMWRRSSSLNGMLADSLNGARVVKAFSKEVEETQRFNKYATKLCQAHLSANKISLFIFPFVSLLIGLSSQLIWGFGGAMVIGKQMTYGELTAYFGYLGMIFGPLNFFTNFTNLVTDTMNSAQRMFETIDTIPEITDSPDAVTLDTLKGDIEFDHVSFHYSVNKPILKDVSFHIRPGDHVGVVGHTGSGKSTIANLITRMYDTISGSVSIDGINIKDIKGESLRKNIAIVSQEVYIFGGTIADNIRYARPDAGMDEVIAAAKAANAHDFIMKLPEGYETIVGIGSRSLSGGERQRVSIARALLLNPSLLILDEATAAMDNETERLISEAIDKLIKGKTTITIAHRLSTLRNCNYIMAIENGEVAEMGPAKELIEQKGVYYKLWSLQNEQMQQVVQGN